MPAPAQNRLLAALPRGNLARLLPVLERVQLLPGRIIHAAGEQARHLYFPVAGIVSRVYETEGGESSELSLVGNEGAVGVSLLLGGFSTPSQALVVCAGDAYRIRAASLTEELDHFSPLLAILLRYTQVMIAQTGQMAVCNRYHSAEQQLCRWLLSCLDRSSSNVLTITQEAIARMLGVRRETVTVAAQTLQRAGLIHIGRGHMTILDRVGLEAEACECYGVVKREYQRLLPPASAVGGAGVQGSRDPPDLRAEEVHARHALCGRTGTTSQQAAVA
ncbi:MAG: Crp/Fnr family transcriptional regulator [Betaproteobacteria bacterium]